MKRIQPVKLLRTVIGIILGETSLVLLTTLVQEVLYDGISFTHSPVIDIFAGGILTMLAAVVSGCIATLAGGLKNIWPAVIISIIICAEMTYLILTNKTADPVWFDLLAGLSLVFGIWIGRYVVQFLFKPNPSSI